MGLKMYEMIIIRKIYSFPLPNLPQKKGLPSQESLFFIHLISSLPFHHLPHHHAFSRGDIQKVQAFRKPFHVELHVVTGDVTVVDQHTNSRIEADMAHLLALERQQALDGIGIHLKTWIFVVMLRHSHAGTEIDGIREVGLTAVPEGGDVVAHVLHGVVSGLRHSEPLIT